MVTILGTIKVLPQHLEAFLVQIREHAAASAREPGCIRYDVLQDTNDPLTICLYEVFRSEADLEVHRGEPHYHRWMAVSREWRDRTSYSRRVLRSIYPEADAAAVRS